MVWFVEPMQRKADLSWQLVAKSDEGGGFHPCCDHPHATAEEAQDCAEAQKQADAVTGVPTFRPRPKPAALTEAQIKHMVDRFLAWRLPESFNPDCGITFQPICNAGTPYASKRTPVGTNLLDAEQAKAMVLHMIEGMPETSAD